MASLGNFLVTKILGHSAAEKAFRPWWDNLEDFLCYGLVMLGLIVAPTAIVNGTPLECNLCTQLPCNYSRGQVDEGSGGFQTQTDPKYNLNWVKKMCTATAVDGFTAYFPFILLVMALVIVLIERVFIRMFKAGLKLDTFYNLLVKEALENDALMTSTSAVNEGQGATTGAGGQGSMAASTTAPPAITTTTSIIPLDLENTKMAIEVSQSFSNSSSYFVSYLIRTLSETTVAAGLLAWLILFGMPAIQMDEFVFCTVHGYQYECAGHPQEFYMYVLFITIAILAGYLFCCVYNLLWLAVPRMANLNKVMNDYRRELRRQKVEAGIIATDHQLLGNLFDVYYHNRDLKLLLNLLATSSGISPSLRILTLFDKNFRAKMEPSNLEVNVVPNTSDPATKVDAEISFDDAIAIRNNFSKIKEVNTIYTVEIIPPPPSGLSAVHVFKYGIQETEEELGLEDFFPAVTRSGKNGKKKKGDLEMENLKKRTSVKNMRFVALDANQEYTIRVCTVVNGRAIARKIRRINCPSTTAGNTGTL